MGGSRRWDPAMRCPGLQRSQQDTQRQLADKVSGAKGRTWDADWILAAKNGWTPIGAAKVKMFKLTGVCQGRNQECPWGDAPGGVYSYREGGQPKLEVSVKDRGQPNGGDNVAHSLSAVNPGGSVGGAQRE